MIQAFLGLVFLLMMLWLLIIAPLRMLAWLIMTPWRRKKERERQRKLLEIAEVQKARIRGTETFRPLLPFLVNSKLMAAEPERFGLLLREHILASYEEYAKDPSPECKRHLKRIISLDKTLN